MIREDRDWTVRLLIQVDTEEYSRRVEEVEGGDVAICQYHLPDN